MQRRQFLQTILAGSVLAAGWQTASASGITIGSDGSELNDKTKPKPFFASSKGFCANDESPDAVNALNPQWMYIEFGPWNWNMDARYNCKWALHLLDMIPNADDVAKAIQHPAYDGWWLTLNEPDLTGMSQAQAVELVTKQMQVVLSVDPNAKFCVGMGSQLHAVNTSDAWFPTLWSQLPADLKASVRAFHTHFYAQCQSGLSYDQLFTPEPIVKYVQAIRKWMNKNAQDFKRELWITEIGMATDDRVANDPRLALYPVVVQNAMNSNAERWAWYSMSTNDGYATLASEPYSSVPSALGRVFAGIVPGVYPTRPTQFRRLR